MNIDQFNRQVLAPVVGVLFVIHIGKIIIDQRRREHKKELLKGICEIIHK